MKLRRFAAMISSTNEYSCLKWPLTLISILITVIGLLLLISFSSGAWFTYEVVRVNNATNTTGQYSHIISHGSFGLWTHCSGMGIDSTIKCDTYTRESRPERFSLILILASVALLLVNLTFFPSWASTILVLYNTNNHYIPYIIVFLWITLLLTLTITVLLTVTMMFIGSTSFYSPGKSSRHHITTVYHIHRGVYLMLVATILSIVSLVLAIATLIWEKFIEMRLNVAEKELYRRLADDNFEPGWHKIVRVPRTSSRVDDNLSAPPPPYSYNNRGTNQ